jgi:hypothetical protein
VGKPEVKNHLEDQGMDGIKMDLREIGWGGVEWIQLAQVRDHWRAVVNAVMNLRVLAPRSQLVQLMKLLIMHFSSIPSYLLPLGSINPFTVGLYR